MQYINEVELIKNGEKLVTEIKIQNKLKILKKLFKQKLISGEEYARQIKKLAIMEDIRED